MPLSALVLMRTDEHPKGWPEHFAFAEFACPVCQFEERVFYIRELGCAPPEPCVRCRHMEDACQMSQ